MRKDEKGPQGRGSAEILPHLPTLLFLLPRMSREQGRFSNVSGKNGSPNSPLRWAFHCQHNHLILSSALPIEAEVAHSYVLCSSEWLFSGLPLHKRIDEISRQISHRLCCCCSSSQQLQQGAQSNPMTSISSAHSIKASPQKRRELLNVN